MKRLKKLFNNCAAPIILSAGFMFGHANAQEVKPQQAPQTASCAAFPDFKKPEIPMHRISRNIDPDPAIEERQELLGKLSLNPGRADGRTGVATRMAEREYLLFYGPLLGVTNFDRNLDDGDLARLKSYAAKVDNDAASYGLTKSTAAALRLASERTGVSIAKLAALSKDADGYIDGVNASGASVADLFKFDNTTWLYLVKTYGQNYGVGFYADRITLGAKNGDVTASVDNPFIHQQVLNLRDNKRLSALLAAEYVKNASSIPSLDIPQAPVFSDRVQEEQKALFELGFNIGSAKADGIKGTMTDISMRQFQLLHGDGKATGVLSATEHKTLIEAAQRAKIEENIYNVPSLAIGAIRMASTRNNLEFGYMMELAEAESAFIHNIKASTTSATGLYQFIESTWHYMISTYGHKYGLGDLSSQVDIYNDDYGRPQARIANPLIRGGVVEMRKHPHLSSLFSADFQLENKAKELCYVAGGNLSRTDMYMAHFLGAHDAVYFINGMRFDPDKSAVATFPEAAEYNINVFYEMQGRKPVRERSLKEVYGFFDKKFNRNLYEGAPAAIIPVAALVVPVVASKMKQDHKKAAVSKPVKKPVKKTPPKKKQQKEQKKRPK